MTTILIYIIAAVVIILLLTKSIFRKIQGYIIFDRIDIQCEVQLVSRILKVDRTIACDGTKVRLFVEKASNEGAKIV